MPRLRRLVVSDRWFFITCRVLPGRGILTAPEFTCLGGVIHERREKHGFLLSAWAFLPDHWHAIFYPSYPLTICMVMESIKVGATKRINRSRGKVGLLFQPRFFDRALRAEREYHEKVEYIHLNPVKAGWASRTADWPWSSVHDYTGNVNDRPVTPSGLSVDGLFLPADPRIPIGEGKTTAPQRGGSGGRAAE
jgi:putative transposase